MKKQKTEKFKTNKGITLIALVITIIVMLILVSVTISMAINGGIFDYAKKAVDDTKNAIAYEQELADGRINIGGVWYDSIKDYIEGKPSQTSEGLIVKATPREELGIKYIDLEIQVDGVKPIEEYALDYAKYQMQHFIKYNVCHDKTLDELEGILKDLKGNQNGVIGDDNFTISAEVKAEVISQATQIIYTMADIHVEIPYEESLRIVLFYMENQSNYAALDILLEAFMVDMAYCYFCDIMGIEPSYDGATIEQQILQLLKFKGTFDEFLTTLGENRTDLELEASDTGVTWGMYLKAFSFQFEDLIGMLDVNVTVSNGDSFVMSAMGPYEYIVPENGTYTFTAELQDGSGRKGKTTVVVSDDVTNPYDENDWEMAWTYSATDGWSDLIKTSSEVGENIDIIAKLYATGNEIEPVSGFGSALAGVNLVKGPEYKLIIEGKGKMPDMVQSENSTLAWHDYSPMAIYLGKNPEVCYTYYISEVYVCEGIENIPLGAFFDFTNLKNIKIADSVVEIGEEAFFCNTSLLKVDIPKNIEKIAKNAFEGCKSLTNITILENVKEIGAAAFWGCSSLESVTFSGNNIENISDSMFRSCTKLSNISLPQNITNIGDRAFEGCSSLINITIPENVKTIGMNAFNMCTALTTITIPNSVETLMDDAFNGCSGLQSVTISSKVTQIDDRTFRDCTSLKNITILGEVTEIGINAFDNIPEDATFYVPNQNVKNLILNEVGSYCNVVIQ